MENKMGSSSHDPEIRKGPWTMEEDLILINYIANHGEGVWNTVARSAGLKRTGKSCRLRWLNYLRPDVRRGNITPEEQLLIMDLHSRWGNRWSKIARQLPGRTDNEIKNYWRTRIQKKAKSGTEHHHLDYQNSTESIEGSGGGRQAVIGMEEGAGGGATCSANYAGGSIINYPHLMSPPQNDGAPGSEAAAFWSMEDLWSTMHLFNGESMN